MRTHTIATDAEAGNRVERSEPTQRDAGFSLVEVVVAGLIGTLVASTLAVALMAALRSAQVTSALAADATEAAVVGAYLTRDARAAAAALEALGDTDPRLFDGSLGVSTIDPLECRPDGPSVLGFRLAWPRSDTTVVVAYSVDSTEHRLVRSTCERSSSSGTTGRADVVLADGVDSLGVSCSPASEGCMGLPDTLTLEVTGRDGDDPFRYAVTAGMRTGARPGPTTMTDVSVAVIGHDRCPALQTTGRGRLFAAHDVVVDGSCAVPLDDPTHQLQVGGSIALPAEPGDPYLGRLAVPVGAAPTNGVNPYPIGTSAGPTAVNVSPLPVTITTDTVFAPGVHVFERGLSIGPGARVAGDDVVWYVEGGLVVSPSASVDIDAPDSGDHAGIVVWAAGDDDIVIGNDAISSSFDGIFYAPDAQVTIERRAGVCVGALLVGSLTLAGNGPLHAGHGTDRCDTSASLWTPESLGADVALWLDAAAATTIVSDAADATSEWRDRSANRRNATQPEPLRRPRWETGSIDGLAALRFDGVDDALGFDGSFLAGSDYSIVTVTQRASARPSNLYLGGQADDLLLGWDADDLLGHTHADGPLQAAVTAFGSPGRAVIHSAIAAGSGRRVRVHGVDRASSPGVAPLDAWPGAAVGAARGSSFDGWVGEMVVVTRLLSTAELERIEAYLAWKWGTSAELPIGSEHHEVPPLAYTPGAPVALAAVAGDGDASVAWQTPVGQGRRAADDFVVDYATDDSFTRPVRVASAPTAGSPLAVTVDGLATGTPVWIRVAARNGWGIGPYASIGPLTPRDHRSAVMATGPSAYWRFGEPSGSVVHDETASARHGSAQAITLGAPGALVASADTAVEIGTASAVALPLPGGPDTPGRIGSIALWLRSNSPGVVVAGSDASGAVRPLIDIDASGVLRASLSRAGVPSPDEIAVSSPVLDGGWHHVVVTGDGATLRLHLDGALVATALVVDTPGQVGPAWLHIGGVLEPGTWSATSQPYVGGIDDLSLHDGALGADEIAALHRSGVTGLNDGIAPGEPALSLRPTPSHVTATWGAAAESDVVGYRLYRNGTLIGQQASTTPVVDEAYAADTDAGYALEAYDVRGNRSTATVRTARPMVIVVDTTKSAGTTVELPLRGAVDAVVDWQGVCGGLAPSTTTTVVDPARAGTVSCTYLAAGSYTIRVFGSVARYGLGVQAGTPPSYPNQEKILSINAWGDLGLESLSGAFVRSVNLASLPSNLPATVTDTTYMFQRATNFNQDIGSWDTSNVTTMSYMFQYAAAFNNGCPSGVGTCPSIGSWDIGRVTRTDRMFESANAFNQNIGGWDMSSVTTMQAMFYAVAGTNPTFNNGCAPGESTVACSTIGSWDTRNVTSLRTTFLAASAFNQDIGGWDTASVTSMYQAFYNATRFDQPIGTWDVGNVQTMWRMFGGATSFDGDISAWRTPRVSDMGEMFRGASRFNRDLSTWCVPLVRSEPSNFATGATSWMLPRPPWGTCSSP